LLALSPWSPALGGATPERHCLWELHGDHNTVFLLGSVHMLSAADGALPQAMTDAYSKSAALVMELDLNDVGAESMLGSAFEATMLPEGQSLGEVLGPSLYAEFIARAEPLGIEPTMAERLQPWFAALMLEQLTLAKSGLAADAGVDMQLAQRAQIDHKPIIALETVADQLGYFSRMTLTQQKDFLRTTLRELDTEGSDTARVVRAWQHGDTAELERLMHKDAVESPELFRVLTTDRNRKWLPRITALLHDSQDYLVVVGTLHLVGRDGIVELLRREGHEAVQR
jgi:uncharacterized protein